MKKTLGLSTALATVVGSVIGSGVFFKPQSIYTTTAGAPGLGMMAWIIGGLASIAAALTFAEIAILIPKTGGMVAYLEEAYDKKIGYRIQKTISPCLYAGNRLPTARKRVWCC